MLYPKVSDRAPNVEKRQERSANVMGSLKTWCELERRRMNLSVVAVRTRQERDKDGKDTVRPG